MALSTAFSKAALLTDLEGAVSTGLATFAASQIFVTGLTEKGLVAALIAAGTAALYQFVKQVGGTQATAATVKVKAA